MSSKTINTIVSYVVGGLLLTLALTSITFYSNAKAQNVKIVETNKAQDVKIDTTALELKEHRDKAEPEIAELKEMAREQTVRYEYIKESLDELKNR